MSKKHHHHHHLSLKPVQKAGEVLDLRPYTHSSNNKDKSLSRRGVSQSKARTSISDKASSSKRIKFTNKSAWMSKRGFKNFYRLENQDFVLVEEKENERIYGVFDGHGKYGTLVSQTAANKFLERYENQVRKSSVLLIETPIEEIVSNIISETNEHLCSMLSRECQHSGSTALIIVLREKELYCFNVGGSRAVLAKKSRDQQLLMPFPLSTDQTLDRFDEKKRVQAQGAVLEQLRDENNLRVGPERVWKKGQRYPGTFITRSLGMHLSTELGIISKPEYVKLKLRPSFEFILAGSDGFWSVFESREALDVLTPYWLSGDLQKGLGILFKEAIHRWQSKPDLMDDISLILIKI